MDFLAWIFTGLFWVMYIVCIFTVCLMTFRKGHVVLGVVGFFFPFLWLIGAVLPAKRGSHNQTQVSQYFK